jgi:ubiquinol-cytochrome c reductase cytochrome b subunit
MNQLGSAVPRSPVRCSRRTRVEETRALAVARHEAHERELEESRRRHEARAELESRSGELAGRPDDGGRPQQPRD